MVKKNGFGPKEHQTEQINVLIVGEFNNDNKVTGLRGVEAGKVKKRVSGPNGSEQNPTQYRRDPNTMNPNSILNRRVASKPGENNNLNKQERWT